MNPRAALRRRAFAALGMVLALLILQLLVVSMTTMSSRGGDLRGAAVEGARAFYAAEAALAIAVREAKTRTDIDGDGAIGGISDDGNASSGPVLAGVRLSVAASPSGGDIVLTAAIRVGAASRTVRATVRPPASGNDPADAALLTWTRSP